MLLDRRSRIYRNKNVRKYTFFSQEARGGLSVLQQHDIKLSLSVYYPRWTIYVLHVWSYHFTVTWETTSKGKSTTEHPTTNWQYINQKLVYHEYLYLDIITKRKLSISTSMQQNYSSESNRFSASQKKIPRTLCKPKIRCRIHKCPPPVPDRSLSCSQSTNLKILFNIILPPTYRSSKLFHCLRRTKGSVQFWGLRECDVSWQVVTAKRR
jgi:hypothetical protein